LQVIRQPFGCRGPRLQAPVSADAENRSFLDVVIAMS
jgi:hypothetical protein